MKLIIDNENKNLSRKRKRRIQRIFKMNYDLKSLLNKIKSEKKKKNKNFDKNKHLDILLVRIKYAKNPNKLQSVLKELNQIHVVNKILHEIKQELLKDDTGEFEMIGDKENGDQSRQTNIRFRNVADYES